MNHSAVSPNRNVKVGALRLQAVQASDRAQIKRWVEALNSPDFMARYDLP